MYNHNGDRYHMKSNALLMALLSGVLVACGGGQEGTTATPNTLLATVEACAVWDAATVYTGGQCVTYQGVSYKAKRLKLSQTDPNNNNVHS